jgi:hypothetical protein
VIGVYRNDVLAFVQRLQDGASNPVGLCAIDVAEFLSRIDYGQWLNSTLCSQVLHVLVRALCMTAWRLYWLQKDT